MSRKKKRAAVEPPEISPYGEDGPLSMRGEKFADGRAIEFMVNMDARRKSCLPFVSWEESIGREDEARAMEIPYPREAPPGLPDTLHNSDALRSARVEIIRRLKGSALPRILNRNKSDLQELFPFPKGLDRVNPAFVVLFYSLNLKQEKLFELADIRLSHSIQGRLVHLMGSRRARSRFTQLGDDLRGIDPRLAAWRAWFDFQHGNAARHDYLMDLRSFAWLTLQQDLPFNDCVIGGTIVQQGEERAVLHATRTDRGWYVEEYRGLSQGESTILLMS
jgi:hypothetical protein